MYIQTHYLRFQYLLGIWKQPKFVCVCRKKEATDITNVEIIYRVPAGTWIVCTASNMWNGEPERWAHEKRRPAAVKNERIKAKDGNKLKFIMNGSCVCVPECFKSAIEFKYCSLLLFAASCAQSHSEASISSSRARVMAVTSISSSHVTPNWLFPSQCYFFPPSHDDVNAHGYMSL